MAASLTPCSVCRRHARADEAACPFCGGALTAVRPFAHVETRGLSRAAVISLAASLGLLGCIEEDAPVPHYGAPAPRVERGAGGASAGSGGAAGDGGGGEAGAGGK